MISLIINLLKNSDEPISGSEILDQIKIEKGLFESASKDEKRAFEQKVSNAVNNLKRANIIEDVKRVGRDSFWRIKPISLD